MRKINLKEFYNNKNLKKDIYIEGISSNTSKIQKNYLYVALKGQHNDGHSYIKKAFQNGAKAVLVEKKDKSLDKSYCQIVVENTYLEFTRISCFLNSFSNNLNIIGITGTDGKTSSSTILFKLLNILGNKTAYIGTNGVIYNNKLIKTNCTTPLQDKLYKILKDIENNDIKNLAIEVSSHALSTHRVDYLNFNFVVYLNLTRDHLDFHKNFNDYKNAKLRLFDLITEKTTVLINLDDKFYHEFLNKAKLKTKKIFTFSLNNKKADIYTENINSDFFGSRFNLIINNKRYNDIMTKLVGKYNIYNIILSIKIINSLGYSIDDIKDILPKIKNIEGRMECFYNKKRDFYSVIDFGHAAGSIKNILKEIRKFTKNKLIVVTGAVGDGDKGKRKLMATECIKNADYAIFTTDQPYSEEPEDIINDMIKDLTKFKDKFKVIICRKLAIKYALDNADKNDTVIVFGKGREDEIIHKSNIIKFNDYEFVKEYMNK